MYQKYQRYQKLFFAVFILPLFFLLFPTSASAHAFGMSYALPVPFWLYAYGSASVLIVSFLIAGFFINEKKVKAAYPEVEITHWKIVSFFRNKVTITVLQIGSVFLSLLAILTGFFGTSSLVENFNMTFFWIIFFLGFTYISALFGNVFATLNPWKIIVEWVEKKTGSSLEKGVLSYPKWFGYWPALVGYFFFIWVELVGRFGPAELSFILFMYTAFTLLSVYMFGKKVWFEQGEFFSVYFRLFSTVAPVQVEKERYYLRLPFVSLCHSREGGNPGKVGYLTKEWIPGLPPGMTSGLVVFILFMLSSTVFDSFRDTTKWMDMYFLLIQAMGPAGGLYAPQIAETFGLIASLSIFWVVYMFFIFLMKVSIRAKQSVGELGKDFIYSLLPIALVYNVAHYYTLFVNQGQSIVKLISDPFGYGWNLFGTGEMQLGPGLLDMNIVWHSQVGLIVVGHIVAVIVAHIVSLKVFPSHRKAVISQFPMLLLMVLFTMTGLWVLSQPLGVGL